MRVIAAILAGGSGSRVGGGTPKQMLLLGGKPVLEHSVAAFDAHPGVDDILIVCREDLIPAVQALAAPYAKVRAVIPGGATRTESSLAAIQAASALAGTCPENPPAAQAAEALADSRSKCSLAADQVASTFAGTCPDGPLMSPDAPRSCPALQQSLDASQPRPAAIPLPLDAPHPCSDAFLLLHDAARPLVDAALIGRCLDALAHYDAVEPAIPLADTVVRVDEAGLLSDVPPRATLRAVQTPQCFRLSILAAAYARLAQPTIGSRPAHEQSATSLSPALATSTATPLTDDISVVRRYFPDVPIRVVDGSPRNRKLTVPSDLPLLEALLAAR